MTPTTTPTAADELRETYARALFDADYAILSQENRDDLWNDEIEGMRNRFHKLADAVLTLQAPTLPVPVKEIDALYEKATPGPWESSEAYCGDHDNTTVSIYHYPQENHTVEVLETGCKCGDEAISKENADFIVALVNAWPALRQLHAGASSGWQPISSAPKDGTHILLLHGVYKRAWTGHWREDSPAPGLNWVSSTYEHAYPTNAFSHWQPLPDAPTPPSEGE